jgi:hypothetical protein
LHFIFYLIGITFFAETFISRSLIITPNLSIEVGRYNKTPRNERFCKKCNTDEIEDEMQFLLLCNPFETDRKNILDLVVGEVKNLFPNHGPHKGIKSTNIQRKNHNYIEYSYTMT